MPSPNNPNYRTTARGRASARSEPPALFPEESCAPFSKTFFTAETQRRGAVKENQKAKRKRQRVKVKNRTFENPANNPALKSPASGAQKPA
jgi:hypothetical protein